MLKALENEGLIAQLSKSETERKVKYCITEAGKEEFIKWLQEETISQPVRSEFMLKFLFSNQLPKKKVVEILTDYRCRRQC